ncbi:hypothetical protein HDV01_000858 [Terramyces sp. JEL0728]|nr:hypothetical protein HDV01_000858 [Terramyces sp. JEL0728]
MKLANYKIGNTIGEGAFSKVKAGQHLPSGEKVTITNEVAIKILNKKFLKASKENEERIRKDREKIRVLQEKKRIYRQAMETIKSSQVDVQENLDEFIQKVKQEAENQIVEHNEEPDDYLSDFQKEVLLLMRLNHPNIIKTFKVIDGAEDIYIIMEYCAGGELADLVKKQKHLAEDYARKLFRQIVSAIDFTHASGVVHRDLKLENILLNEDGNILISDFGLGTFVTGDKLDTICGTPYYSAPELMSGQKYNGKKIDIWAMGVIVYYMVAGHPPFLAESIRELERVVRRIQYSVPPEFSKELCVLLQLIFVKERDRIDIEGIRNDGWVNYECVNKPVKYEPAAVDRNSLATVISSVTFDTNCTVYHIRQHNELQLKKDKEHFEKTQQRTSTQDIVSLKRRKSISIQSTREGDSTDGGYAKISKNDSLRTIVQPPSVNAGSITRSSSLGSKNSKSPMLANSPSETRMSSSTSSNRKTLVLAESNEHKEAEQMQAKPASIEQSLNQEKMSRLKETPIRAKYNRQTSNPQIKFKETKSVNRRAASVVEREISMDVSKKIISREASIADRMSSLMPHESISVDLQEVEKWHETHKPATKMRTVKFSLAGSILPPATIFQELHKTIIQLKEEYKALAFERVPEYYTFAITVDGAELQAEVVKVWLGNMHAIRFKKIYGKSKVYFKFCDALLLNLDLN